MWLVWYVESDTMIVEGIGFVCWFSREIGLKITKWLSETLMWRNEVDVVEWGEVNLIVW